MAGTSSTLELLLVSDGRAVNRSGAPGFRRRASSSTGRADVTSSLWQQGRGGHHFPGKHQKAGLLCDAVVDDHCAGYVAAEPGHRLGLAGFTVAELILTEAMRGQRVGKHLITLLSRQLLHRGEPGSVLIGTIRHDNTGAAQAGRRDIGGWVTYSLRRATVR